MVRRIPAHLAIGVLCALGVLLAGVANAQWRVAQDTPNGAASRIDIALVENDSGHSLRLYSDDTQNVRGIFTIRGGFDTIDPAGCPTYRVDKREPERVSFGNERCRILPKQAEFTLGKSGPGRNRRLHRIMNGSSLVFRYRLGNGVYRQTTFSLRGSKYALTTALRNSEVGADE